MMTNQPPSRTVPTGCLVILPVIFTLFQIIHVFHVLQLPAAVHDMVSIPVWLDVVTHILWAVAGTFGAISLARSQPFALRYTGWLFVTFLVYSALRLLLFAQSDYDTGRLSLVVLLVAVLLLPPVIILIQRGWMNIKKREVIQYDVKPED